MDSSNPTQKRKPVKEILLNQRVGCGLCNIVMGTKEALL